MISKRKGQQWLLMSEQLLCSCDGFCGASEQEAGAHVTCRLADGNLEPVRVKGGMSLRNGMWHGLRNDIIMRNVIYVE